MAIDIHVHPQDEYYLENIGPGFEFVTKYFHLDPKPIPLEVMLGEMDEAGISHAVIFGAGDTRYRFGKTVGDDHIAGLVARAPDRLIGFCGVDPHFGVFALDGLRRAVEELGLRGVKFHPSYQDFRPDNKEQCYSIYEKCIEYDIPILLHTGTTGLGCCHIEKSRPYMIDTVAQDFPELKVIMAHAGWPWVDECIAVMLHNPNVYIDLSGYLPRYHPEHLYRRLRSAFPERVLFGTDYPMIGFQRWLDDFHTTTRDILSDEVRQQILEDNARRLLKLG